MYINDIMTKEVVTVREDATVQECARLLITHNLSGMPVLDEEGRVSGIVTEGDLIRRASKVEGPPILEVLGGVFYLESPKQFAKEINRSMGSIAKDIMTKNVITINGDKKLEEATTLLVGKRIKRLPVLDNEGNLIGIISRRDIMNYLFDGK